MNTRFLETLVWVARLRNFHHVAERLHTSQPAISSRIQALEAELGVPLVDRSVRDVQLTPEGLETLRYAEAVVALVDEMRVRLSDPGSLQGSIRIGVIGSIIYAWLPQFIERLRTTYPNVIFELSADTTAHLARALKRGEIDLALLMGPIDDAGVENIDLGSFPMVWVANPRHFRFDRPIDVTELAAQPILSYPRDSQPYRMLERYFRSSRIRRPLINASSFASVVQLAVAGIGIAAIPPVTVLDELDRGRLAIVPVRQVFPPIAFTASYRLSPAAELARTVAEMARAEAEAFAVRLGPDCAGPPR